MKSTIINGTQFTEITYRLDGEDMPGILVHDILDTYRDGDGIIGDGAELPETEEDAKTLLANEHVETCFRLVDGIYVLDPMTYREYMEEHPEENLSWCKPYRDDSGEYCLIVHDGEAEHLEMPGRVADRWDGTLTDDLLEDFAQAINPHFEDKEWIYKGWSTLHIALDVMHEVGCSECPCNSLCDAMGEEVNACDYR